MAPLRKRRFFALAEVNGAIAEWLDKPDKRVFRKMRGSRVELYNTIERPPSRSMSCWPAVTMEQPLGYVTALFC